MFSARTPWPRLFALSLSIITRWFPQVTSWPFQQDLTPSWGSCYLQASVGGLAPTLGCLL